MRQTEQSEIHHDSTYFNNGVAALVTLNHRVDKLHYLCYRTRRDMKNGRICKVCRLAKKVDDFMLGLFKDAAKGRTPSSIT